MINDLKSSINSILNERLVSPLFGTFIFSWTVWNWRIIYLTFFVSEKILKTDKITYILNHFYEDNVLYIYPLISTIILLTIAPFLSNGTYWLSLIFNQWKINKKNEVQKNQLITLEQSITLREQIKNSENRFEELLEDKKSQIKLLELELHTIKNSELNLTETDVSKPSENNYFKEEEEVDAENFAYNIKQDSNLNNAFEILSSMIQRRYSLHDIDNAPDTILINYFLSNNIIENDESGKFNFTSFGKKVAKFIYDIKL